VSHLTFIYSHLLSDPIDNLTPVEKRLVLCCATHAAAPPAPPAVQLVLRYIALVLVRRVVRAPPPWTRRPCEGPIRQPERGGGSEWEPIKNLLEGDCNSDKMLISFLISLVEDEQICLTYDKAKMTQNFKLSE
jgi:hypothetical protein